MCKKNGISETVLWKKERKNKRLIENNSNKERKQKKKDGKEFNSIKISRYD